MARRTIRYNDQLANDISQIAKSENTNDNLIIIRALEFYRDHYYMKEKANFINESIVNIVHSTNNLLERSINYKTNKVLSELAIQCCIQNQILANSLEVSDRDLNRYRLRALDFLKENNRLFRMDEVDKE